MLCELSWCVTGQENRLPQINERDRSNWYKIIPCLYTPTPLNATQISFSPHSHKKPTQQQASYAICFPEKGSIEKVVTDKQSFRKEEKKSLSLSLSHHDECAELEDLEELSTHAFF